MLTQADLAVVQPWFSDRESRRWLGNDDWPVNALRLAAEGKPDRVAWLGISEPGEPVAVADVEIEDSIAAFALVVAPDARRRGIAAAMIDALALELSRRGVRTLWGGVEEGNVASLALVRSAGFTVAPSLDADGFFEVRRVI